MKAAIAAIAAILLAMVAPCLGNDDVVVQIKYKEEDEDPCQPSAWEAIYGDGGRRQLRANRDLQSCRWSNCAGCDTLTTCRLTGQCGRRQLEEHEQHRELTSPNYDLYGNTCRSQLLYWESQHLYAEQNAEQNGMSKECLDHIKSRNLDCYNIKRKSAAGSVPTLQYEINSFNLLRADLNSVVEEDMGDGYSFCEGDYEFSIEAVAGNKVNKVSFELTRADGFQYKYSTHDKKPFRMFAETTRDKKDITGALYPAGKYDLKAIPDDDISKAQFLSFTIEDCTPPTISRLYFSFSGLITMP